MPNECDYCQFRARKFSTIFTILNDLFYVRSFYDWLKKMEDAGSFSIYLVVDKRGRFSKLWGITVSSVSARGQIEKGLTVTEYRFQLHRELLRNSPQL